MADARSNIAIKLQTYRGKEVMQEKEHVSMYGATCATTLSLPSVINRTGRIAIVVKTVIALKESR